MTRRNQDRILEPMYPPPEFDIELCFEVIDRIIVKSQADPEYAQELGVKITRCIGFLCNAFEEGFLDEIDASIGNDTYAVRVYMSRHNTRPVDL